jgi:bifunctional non-homologous end joining protein LigD
VPKATSTVRLTMEERTDGRQRVRVGDRTLTVSSLDRVLYPATGTTKADALRYYLGVAEVLLPHLRGRPVTLIRYPAGVDGESFFQKRCPDPRPDWLPTIEVPRRRDGGESLRQCEFAEPAALAWATNLGALELHVPLGCEPQLSHPTSVVFDLDPGAPSGLLDCARLAQLLRTSLARLGLTSLVKTSGGKGLHVHVPVDPGATTPDAARDFARELAAMLERLEPDRVVTTQRRAARPGKVLIDWTQNHPAKTSVSVYSLRGRERPTVATPVTWDELDAAVDEASEEALRFGFEDVLVRVAERGDLFADVLGSDQRLPRGRSS